MEMDLLNNDLAFEETQHKLKRLVQNPNSFFLDVKCKQCQTVTTMFSHSQTIVYCRGCGIEIATPTGGKAKIVNDNFFRRKGD